MGQRHQAFVIARIRPAGGGPPRLRCIAAFHHQWCYGTLPLGATRRFLTLVKQKSNADIIKAEIRAIEGKYTDRQDFPAVPCPFVAFLLASSWTTDLEDPKNRYISGRLFSHSILNANMESGAGDNNDGITIIDVTDPLSPAYCFVFPGVNETAEDVPMWRPLSATVYVRAYYPKSTAKDSSTSSLDDDDEDIIDAIKSLEGERVVDDVATLAEAWPEEYQCMVKKTDEEVSLAKNSPDLPFVKSLAELTLEPAVSSAIETGETAVVAEMLWLPGKCAAVRAILQKQTSFSDAAVTLMARIIAHEMESSPGCIDLQDFALSPEQVIQLLAPFAQTLTTLDLSYNPHITVATIRSILIAFPGIKRLVVLGCPSIGAADIFELLEHDPKLFYHLEALIHPLLFQRLIDTGENAQYPISFSFIARSSQGCVRTGALPIFTPTSVVQTLTDWLPCFYNDPYYLIGERFLDSSFVPLSVFSAVPRVPGQKWSERTVSCIPQFSVRGLLGLGWVFGLHFDYDHRRYGFLRFESETQDGHKEQEEHEEQEEYEEQEEHEEHKEHKEHEEVEKMFTSPPVEIRDLRGFLDIMVADGRPRAPENNIKKLEEILQILEKDTKLKLFQQSDMSKFVTQVILNCERMR